MALLETNQTAAEQTAEQLRRGVKSMYTSMAVQYRTLFNKFWRNSNATPEEISTALGNECAELFRLSSVATEMLNEAKAGTIVNDFPNEFVVNNDGTVTITPNEEEGENE